MESQSFELRLGGIVVLIGGCGAFVANIFHPSPPGKTEELIQMLLAHPHWSQLHFVILLSVVLLVGGLSMLTRNLDGVQARGIGALGRYFLLLGSAVYCVEAMVDGFATRRLADRWAQAPAADKAALFASADAVANTWEALFPVFSGIFLGLAMLTIGLAIVRSKNFPRWLGYWGVLGGSLCFVTGVGVGLRLGASLPVWLAGVSLNATWGIPIGIMMWRRSAPDSVPRPISADQ